MRKSNNNRKRCARFRAEKGRWLERVAMADDDELKVVGYSWSLRGGKRPRPIIRRAS